MSETSRPTLAQAIETARAELDPSSPSDQDLLAVPSYAHADAVRDIARMKARELLKHRNSGFEAPGLADFKAYEKAQRADAA